MTSREFRTRLGRRLKRAAVGPPLPDVAGLEAYFRLLATWNRKMNLTALPLDPPTDETFDRLFVEPLAAGHFVPAMVGRWVDLGSGGGSPAIPLKIVRPDIPLVMVESKSRKAAFLREAIRVLALPATAVENSRLEQLAANSQFAGTAGLVTVRAVRLDDEFLRQATSLLRSDGQLFVFHGRGTIAVPAGIARVDTVQIGDSQAQQALLSRFRLD